MGVLFVPPNDWIEFGQTDTARQVPAVTMCAWVTPDILVGTEDYLVFFSRGTTTPQVRVSISMDLGTNKYRVRARRLDADAIETLDESGTSVAVGVTTHIVGVWEFTNQILRIYIDGVQSATLAVPGWTGLSENTASLSGTLGARDTSGLDPFGGSIGDVRVYHRALEPVEIGNIFAARGRDRIVDGMRHRYVMIGASGDVVGVTDLKDIGILQNNPTGVAGAPTWTPRDAAATIARIY